MKEAAGVRHHWEPDGPHLSHDEESITCRCVAIIAVYLQPLMYL